MMGDDSWTNKIKVIQVYSINALKARQNSLKSKLKQDAKGSKSLHKDKSSESLPHSSLTYISTNYSAFKYLIYQVYHVSQVNAPQSVYRNGSSVVLAILILKLLN
jgi:hypothetical protein